MTHPSPPLSSLPLPASAFPFSLPPTLLSLSSTSSSSPLPLPLSLFPPPPSHPPLPSLPPLPPPLSSGRLVYDRLHYLQWPSPISSSSLHTTSLPSPSPFSSPSSSSSSSPSPSSVAPLQIHRLSSHLTRAPHFINTVARLTLISEGASGRAYRGYLPCSSCSCLSLSQSHDDTSRVCSSCAKVVVKLPKEEMGLAEWREWQSHLRVPPHPHVVHFLGALVVEHTNYLVTRWVQQGSLHQVLLKRSTRDLYSSPFALMKAAKEIAQGLLHLHSHAIVHRDISSRNVLVENTGTFVIADLGLSREMKLVDEVAALSPTLPARVRMCSLPARVEEDRLVYASQHSVALPARWTAPEALRYDIYSARSDVWSLGICLWEMTARARVPYADIRENWKVIADVLSGDAVLNVAPDWPFQSSMHTVSDDAAIRARRIIKTCLEREIQKRPSSKELLILIEAEWAEWRACFPQEVLELEAEWQSFHHQLSCELASAEALTLADCTATNNSDLHEETLANVFLPLHSVRV